MKSKLVILCILLLLIPLGIGFAQSTDRFDVRGYIFLSGGSANSSSYNTNRVIGLPAAGESTSASYVIRSGFLSASQQTAAAQETIWLPHINK